MNAKQVINLFGGIRPMAEALGHPNPTTVQYWGKKGFPRWRHHEILAAAKAMKIKISAIDLNGRSK